MKGNNISLGGLLKTRPIRITRNEDGYLRFAIELVTTENEITNVSVLLRENYFKDHQGVQIDDYEVGDCIMLSGQLIGIKGDFGYSLEVIADFVSNMKTPSVAFLENSVYLTGIVVEKKPINSSKEYFILEIPFGEQENEKFISIPCIVTVSTDIDCVIGDMITVDGEFRKFGRRTAAYAISIWHDVV